MQAVTGHLWVKIYFALLENCNVQELKLVLLTLRTKQLLLHPLAASCMQSTIEEE